MGLLTHSLPLEPSELDTGSLEKLSQDVLSNRLMGNGY